MANSKDLELFGVFREEVGIGVNSPYVSQEKSAVPLPRHGGKQFAVPSSVSGKMAAAFIDKKLQNYSPEPFIDSSKIEMMNSRSSNSKGISGKTFFPAGHEDRSNGAGSLYGCIGAVYLDTTPLPRPKVSGIDGKRKIYASTPKRGGPGFPLQDRTLGTVEEYMPDEYARGRILEKEMKKAAKDRIPKPFASVGSHDRLFTPVSQLYQNPKFPGNSNSTPRERRPSSAPVWRPSSPSKKGAAYCTISRVGRTYAPDPIREAEYKARSKPPQAPFRPGSSTCKKRLSMWTPNPYEREARPPASIDFTLF